MSLLEPGWTAALALALALLVLASALITAVRTALGAASHARIEALETARDRRARIVGQLRRTREQVDGALLVCDTLANAFAAALATGWAIARFGPPGMLLGALGIALLLLLLGEALPTALALRRPEATALVLAPATQLLVLTIGRIGAALGWVLRPLFRLIGADLGRVRLAASVEELRGAIDLHGAGTRAGDGEADDPDEAAEARAERQMLRSILELGEVTVADVMTHRRAIEMLNAREPPARIVERALASPFTRLPLYAESEDNVLGVLHAKALLRAVRGPHGDRRGGDLGNLDLVALATEPWFIPDTTTLLDQLQEFRRRREHFALVVDEYGALQGVVTLEDILEEIVGDIEDEHDPVVAGVEPDGQGGLIVEGTVTVRDLNRRFDWRLPSDDYATIAGLVLFEARRIPQVGQTFGFFGFRFEVLRRHRNQVTLLRVTPGLAAVEEA